MTVTEAVLATNRVLDALFDKDLEQLLAKCEHIEIKIGEVLYSAGDVIPYIYFPTGGFISLILAIKSTTLEVGLVGNEGVLGITSILGDDIAPFTALVQGTGTALRIKTPSFLLILEQSHNLQKVLNRYLYVSMSQLAQSAFCTRFHCVDSRLARWLLMTQDRAHSKHFHITHVYLGYMLGVRRVSITKAAKALQQRKLISYRRGDITVLDRIGLEAVTCACYRADKDIYDRLLGSNLHIQIGENISKGCHWDFRYPVKAKAKNRL